MAVLQALPSNECNIVTLFVNKVLYVHNVKDLLNFLYLRKEDDEYSERHVCVYYVYYKYRQNERITK